MMRALKIGEIVTIKEDIVDGFLYSRLTYKALDIDKVKVSLIRADKYYPGKTYSVDFVVDLHVDPVKAPKYRMLNTCMFDFCKCSIFKALVKLKLDWDDLELISYILKNHSLNIEDIEDLIEVDFHIGDYYIDYETLGYWLIDNGMHSFSQEVVDCGYFDYRQYALDLIHAGDLRIIEICGRKYLHFTH